MKYFIPFAILVTFCTCKQKENCDIRELTHTEMYDRATQGKFLPRDVKIYSASGQIIGKDSVLKYDRDKFAFSEFVDCRDSIVKLVVRPINSADKDLRRKIDSLYSSDLRLAIKRIKYIEKDTSMQKKMIEMARYNMPPVLTKVNCDSIVSLLSSAFIKDQNNRTNINLTIDKENLNLVESIVKFCGLKAIEGQGEEPVFHFFMIIQHAQSKYRKKYIDFFRRASDNGLLDKSTLALMIDRILVDEHKNQLYGTQYRINRLTGAIEISPLQDSLNIDSLRISMGLQPLKQYIEIIKKGNY